MSSSPPRPSQRPLAAHVAAALGAGRPAGAPAFAPPIQRRTTGLPAASPAPAAPAAHVARALRAAPAPTPELSPALQAKAAAGGRAPHLAAALRPPAPGAQRKPAAASAASHVSAAVARARQLPGQPPAQAKAAPVRGGAPHLSAALACRSGAAPCRPRPPAALPTPPTAVQPMLAGIGASLWSWGSAATALAVANPLVSIPLGLAGAYSLYSYWRGGRHIGQYGVEDLPEDQQWRLYINPKDFGEAAESGHPDTFYKNNFHVGMKRAISNELRFGRIGRKVDFEEYTRLHDEVTSGLQEGRLGELETRETTRSLSSGQNLYVYDGRTFTDETADQIPREGNPIWLPPVNFPIDDWSPAQQAQQATLAQDLRNETIGGLPMVGNGNLDQSVVKVQGGRIDVNYSLEKGRQVTQQIFDRYYLEVGAAKTRRGKLEAIVKAIRAVHVTHIFRDANGRLNVNILLNKFLLEQGFDPTILPPQGLGIFGGAWSIEQLADAVDAGHKEFRKLAESKKDK